MAELAKFNPDQVRSYEDSLKYYRDLKNSIDTAREEGKEEGREETRSDIAKSLLAAGMTDDFILQTTGLTEAQLAQLKGEITGG